MYIFNLLFQNGQITIEGLFNVLAFVAALLVALILHEVAHGYVAYLYGDNTAKNSGRLSLNPLKHLNITGLAMLLIVGFGWAKPVPVNYNNFKNKTSGKIAVSLAGVATNFFLAFVSGIFYCIVDKYSSQMNYNIAYFLLMLFYLLIVLNINFGLFNILPLFPLDGFRLLACFVRETHPIIQFLRRYSLYILIGLMVLNIAVPTISPLYWYIGQFGGMLRNAIVDFWKLLIN